jgi:hypothetical protein
MSRNDDKYYYLKSGDIVKEGDEFSFFNKWMTINNHKHCIGDMWTTKWCPVRRLKPRKYLKFDSNLEPDWR